VLILALATPSIAAAQRRSDGPLPDDYREIVRLYVAGDGGRALAELSRWDAEKFKRMFGGFRDAVDRIRSRSCEHCPDRKEFEVFPLKAAILLHAYREIQEQWSTPVSEQPSRCGTGRNALIIEPLAQLLVLVDPDAGVFLKRFYLGMARYASWAHCLAESQQWARYGLRIYPKEAPLLLAAGIASDQTAFYTRAPAPLGPSATPGSLTLRNDLSSRIRFSREVARDAYEDALVADPDFAEARLRLGRVQWYLGQFDKARVSLETVLAKAGPPEVHYLAHLFLGRLLEDRDDLGKAEEHYRNAWAMQPRSEVAAVAVSHVRLLQGDLEGARVVLKEGLEVAQNRISFDPWLPYIILQAPEGERLLDELRRAALR
jgi:tetratricopeptide (TPR) repeat protein